MEPVQRSEVSAWPNEGAALVRSVGFLIVSLMVAGAAMQLGGAVAAGLVIGGGCVAFVGSLVTAARRPSVDVGADGLSIRGRGFVPFAAIERVERDETPYGTTHHLGYLVLRSGERIRLGARFGIFGDAALRRVDEAYEDLNRRIAAHRARTTTTHAAELARGERPKDEWIRTLEARTESAGFRDGAIARSDLLAVVEDPTADPTARAGAALALKKGLQHDERTRVRVAAQASAAPQVRVALESVADETSSEEHAARAVSRVET